MSLGTPVTEEEREQMVAMHHQGKSVRTIAKEMQRSPSTVSLTLRAKGVETDRAQTAEATAARIRLINAQRVDLAECAIQDAFSMRERIWDKYEMVVSTPQGPEHVYLSEPPLKEQSDGVKAFTGYVTSLDTLLSSVEDNNVKQAKDVVTAIFEGLQKFAATTEPDDTDQDHDYDIAKDPDEAQQ